MVLLRLGIVPGLPGATSLPVAVIGTPPLPAPGTAHLSAPLGGPAPTHTRRVKLSSIIDPTLDADVIQLSSAEIQRMRLAYKAKYGDFPSPDVEPTSDMLSALCQVITAGAAPYADFSIWGPHGLRSLRKSVFI